MTTSTQENLEAVVAQFTMQNRLFLNVTSDWRQEDMEVCLGKAPNHAAWLMGHIVSSRYMLGGLIGINLQEPFPELYGMGKGVQEVTYPSLAALTSDWSEIATATVAALAALPEETLNAQSPIQVPIGSETLAGAIAFFAHHEAYTIGQLGLLRRAFGYEAMKYS